jgi:hypothetical protein
MSKNVADLLESRRFDKKFIPDSEQQVLEISSRTVATLENYVIYAGLPKAGKSTFISGLIASCFAPWAVFDQKLHLPETRRKIALFDTESSSYDLHRTMKRIEYYADINNLPDRFEVFTLREDMPKTILELIEKYLSITPDCSVIVIDGLLDLCINYNDEVETRILTNWLKRVTKQYKILIISVLHLGKNTGETLGVLGSNTDRWAQATMTIRKNKDTGQMVLDPKFLRSAEDFSPIAIEWTGKGFTQTEYKEPVIIKNPVGRPKIKK